MFSFLELYKATSSIKCNEHGFERRIWSNVVCCEDVTSGKMDSKQTGLNLDSLGRSLIKASFIIELHLPSY